MRYIIVTLAFGLIVFWLLRADRGRPDQAPPKNGSKSSRQASAQVQDMVSCSHCGVHLPNTEAVKGKRGVYCSHDHQRLAET